MVGGPPQITAPQKPVAPAGPPPSVGVDIPLTPEETAAITRDQAKIVPAETHKSWGDFFEDLLPLAGGTAGGFAGGLGAIPGAAIGASAKVISHTLRHGLEGPPPVIDGRPATKLEAADAESARVAKEIGWDTLTAGVIPELVGAGVNKIVQKPGLMPPKTALDRDVQEANKAAGLRLGAHQIAPETAAGVVGDTLTKAAEGSFVGGAIAKRARQQMVAAVRRAAAAGKDALSQIGAELNTVVKTGPTYDMLPHQVEAAHVFADEVAPKILDLYGSRLSPKVLKQLQTAITGGLSPALTRRVIGQVRTALTTGAKAPVPTPLLDTLDQILASKETIDFASAADLRTSLLQMGKVKDTLLPEAATRLNRKFTGELTSGMDAYQPWTELRQSYRLGARGIDQKTSEVGKIFKGTAPETQSDLLATTHVPANQVDEVVGRLSAINEAIKRAGAKPNTWARMHQIIQLSVLGGGAATGHLTGAAVANAGYETLAGLIAWASHSPSVTKVLTEGLTNTNVREGTATLLRLVSAYNAARGVDSGTGGGPGPTEKILGPLREAAPARAQGPGPGAGGPPVIR